VGRGVELGFEVRGATSRSGPRLWSEAEERWCTVTGPHEALDRDGLAAILSSSRPRPIAVSIDPVGRGKDEARAKLAQSRPSTTRSPP